MTRSETILTNAARKAARLTIGGDHVARIPTGTGWQYAITDHGEAQVRALLGATFAEAKAALR